MSTTSDQIPEIDEVHQPLVNAYRMILSDTERIIAVLSAAGIRVDSVEPKNGLHEFPCYTVKVQVGERQWESWRKVVEDRLRPKEERGV